MDDLKALLHALPQELYDEIFNLTFTIDEISRTIDRTYKPPSSLQVSRSTRQQFAKPYYGDSSIFYISRFRLADYVNSLEPRHRLLFTEIGLFDSEVTLDTAKQLPWMPLRLINKRLNLGNLFSDMGKVDLHMTVEMKVLYPDGTWRWESYCQLITGQFKA